MVPETIGGRSSRIGAAAGRLVAVGRSGTGNEVGVVADRAEIRRRGEAEGDEAGDDRIQQDKGDADDGRPPTVVDYVVVPVQNGRMVLGVVDQGGKGDDMVVGTVAVAVDDGGGGTASRVDQTCCRTLPHPNSAVVLVWRVGEASLQPLMLSWVRLALPRLSLSSSWMSQGMRKTTSPV